MNVMNLLSSKPAPTVDTVLSAFRDTIQQLDDIADAKKLEVAENEAEIVELEQAIEAAHDEQNRATSIAASLRVLVGVPQR